MSKYTIISFAITCLWCYLGFKTLAADYRNRMNVLFSLLCLSMVIWTFFVGISYSLSDMHVIRLYLKIGYTGAFFFYPVNFHFFLILSKKRIKRLRLLVVYLPALIISVANFQMFFIFRDFIRRDGEWLALLDYDNVWMYVYILFILAYFIATFLVALKWHLHTKIRKEKIHSLILTFFYFFTTAVCFVLTLVLPFFGIVKFQFAGIIFFYMYVLGLFFLVSRYRFMNLEKTLMADEIIANISDLVFILDLDLSIIRAHRGGDISFNASLEKMLNTSYFDVVSVNDELREKLTALADGRMGDFTMPVNYRIGQEYIVTKTHFSRIKDRFGDWAGFIAISHEVKAIGDFQQKFKITNRELEIIVMSVSGMSYPEISSSLSISERTVERHLTNVYNKLGIANKIDLYRIAGEYNIRV